MTWGAIVILIALIAYAVNYMFNNYIVSIIVAIIIYMLAANVDLQDKEDVPLNHNLKKSYYEELSNISRFVL